MPIWVKQYPISSEARERIKSNSTPSIQKPERDGVHIKCLLKAGILTPYQSAWNIPLLAVQKHETWDYRPVQDLREVTEQVETIHSTVLNPYTLLRMLPLEHKVYTVFDLKNAFFPIALSKLSKPIFATEWADLELGILEQLTWTWLP